MNTSSLIISAFLLIIPIMISYKEKLYLEKEMIISSLRAVIQLLIIGYLLQFIFDIQNPIFTIILVLVMIFNAAINTKKRGEGIKNVVFISFVAIFVGTIITLFVLVLSKAIKFAPSDIIPICGMLISNAMVAIGLSYRNLNTSFKNRKSEVETKLSLGSDIYNASKDIVRESIKLSIIPTIDSAKTLGIVSLPGTMTGLILGGISPIIAVKYQIMVTFMILSSSSIATMIATYMSYKHFFNDRKQLLTK